MASNDPGDHRPRQMPSLVPTDPMAATRTSTHTSAIPLPQSSFARSFSRPLLPNGTAKPPRAPFASDTNRGSVTSIYSQASTAERPSSVTLISNTRKQPLRAGHTPDLKSVDEEDHLITSKYEGLSTDDVTQKQKEEEQISLVTPRPSTPENYDKPLVSPITRTNSLWSRSAVSPEQSVRHTKIYRSDTIGALTKAISTRVESPTTPTAKSSSGAYGISRTPFDVSPESPEDDMKSAKTRVDLEKMVTIPLYNSSSTDDHAPQQGLSPTATRSMSINSMNPLLESPLDPAMPSMSDRIPAHRRPAQLNLTAAKQAESRSSLTSLPDLIKRATRLASNLDKGKTASRLGLESMFSTGEKTIAKSRNSTYSDVLFSFPAPGSTTPTSLNHEQRTVVKTSDGKDVARSNSRLMELKDIEDDQDEDDHVEDEKAQRRERRRHQKSKRKRRCCGIPLSVFLVLLVLLIVLIVAAVLLPVFLIVIPKRNEAHPALDQCSASLVCHNGGISIMDNNSCACICVDGFTGSQCSTASDPSCTTTSIQNGDITYEKTTVGNSIADILSAASSKFGVHLNSTVLLSAFARNNFSCSAENSLVRFSVSSSLGKRLFMIPDPDPQPLSIIPLPTRVVNDHVTKRAPDSPPPAETENNIVYAVTTSTSFSTSHATLATATPTTSGGAPTPTAFAKVDADKIEFAQVVVLYVLERYRTPSLAVNSQQILDQYLKTGGPASGNSTISVVPYESTSIVANFGNLTIVNADGSTVGGKSTTT